MDKAKSSHATQDTSIGKSAEKSSPLPDTTTSIQSKWQRPLDVESSKVDLDKIEKLFILMTKYEVTEIKLGETYIAKTIHRGPQIQAVEQKPVKEKSKKEGELEIDPDFYAAVEP
jgi:hypothetical protein